MTTPTNQEETTVTTDALTTYCEALNYWRSLTTTNSTYRARMAAYDQVVEAHKMLTVDQQLTYHRNTI